MGKMHIYISAAPIPQLDAPQILLRAANVHPSTFISSKDLRCLTASHLLS